MAGRVAQGQLEILPNRHDLTARVVLKAGTALVRVTMGRPVRRPFTASVGCPPKQHRSNCTGYPRIVRNRSPATPSRVPCESTRRGRSRGSGQGSDASRPLVLAIMTIIGRSIADSRHQGSQPSQPSPPLAASQPGADTIRGSSFSSATSSRSSTPPKPNYPTTARRRSAAPYCSDQPRLQRFSCNSVELCDECFPHLTSGLVSLGYAREQLLRKSCVEPAGRTDSTSEFVLIKVVGCELVDRLEDHP